MSVTDNCYPSLPTSCHLPNVCTLNKSSFFSVNIPVGFLLKTCQCSSNVISQNHLKCLCMSSSEQYTLDMCLQLFTPLSSMQLTRHMVCLHSWQPKMWGSELWHSKCQTHSCDSTPQNPLCQHSSFASSSCPHFCSGTSADRRDVCNNTQEP